MANDVDSDFMRTSLQPVVHEAQRNKVSKSKTSFGDLVLEAMERAYGGSDKAVAAEMQLSKGEFSKLKRSGRWGDRLDLLSDDFRQELTTLLAEQNDMEVRPTPHQIERQMLKVQTELGVLQHMLAVSRKGRATDR